MKGICIICTGKYDVFLQNLIDGLAAHFFKNDSIVIYLFSDMPSYNLNLPCRFSIIYIPTPHQAWPMPTLLRYRMFTNAADKMKICTHIFYLDVDMMVVGEVGDEILGDITVVRHPGFYNNKEWGSQGVSESSTADLSDHEKHRYVAGGFQGGQTDKFLEMSRILADNIDADIAIGYTAPHNDETHLNQFVNKQVYQMFPDWKVKDLTPSYCMISDAEARVKFGLDGLPAIIYCIEKNHEELRKT